MKPEIRRTLEDRLAIKTTQILRRRITNKEQTSFFIKNTHTVDKLHTQFLSELDKLIEKYLEEIK